MQHEPVELRTTSEALLALTKGITHYCVKHLAGGRGDVEAVWFQADRLYLVSADIVDLAFKFEVFPLAVRTPAELLEVMQAHAPMREQAWSEMRAGGIAVPEMSPPVELAPTGELQEWPFRSWQLDVLKRMEFIVAPEHLPDTREALEKQLHQLRPGEAPAGCEHTCLTSMGLLFTSKDGARLLLVADGMPGSMRVADDEETVRSYLKQCIAVPAIDYLSEL